MALATGAAGWVTGCAADAQPPLPRVADTADTADAALAGAAAREAARMLALYRAGLRRHPSLRGLLQPFADHHAEHLAVLAERRPLPADPAPRAVPRKPRAVLTVLRRAEQRSARSRRSAMLEARSGDLARVLASVAACQAQHVVILADESRRARR